MTRTTWTLAFLFVSLFTAVTPASGDGLRDPHIRSNESELLTAVRDGARLSPTLQHLVEGLEASDVVVYLMFSREESPRMAGHIAWLTKAAGRRYLRISIDRRTLGCDRIAILGHELHHAMEIAESPAVTDEVSLGGLYRRIGFKSAVGKADCFDSAGAILAGQLIKRETRERYTELTSRTR